MIKARKPVGPRPPCIRTKGEKEEPYRRQSRELRAVNRALRESEERYRELVSRMPNGVLVHKNGRIVFANDYILNITQCTFDELDGQSVLANIHPDDRQTVARNMALRLARKKAPQGYEVRIATKSGEWRSLVVQAKNIIYESEPAILTVLTDITEKRRSERIQDAIYRISEAAHLSDDLPELFRSIHQVISGLMPAGNFYIALFDPKSGMLSFPYFVDEIDSPPATRGLENGLTEYVLRAGQPLLATPEILADLEKKNEIELIGAPAIDWLGVPLKIGGKTIGVLVVQTYSPGLRYGEEEKSILIFVSDQVAMAIERKRAEASLRRSEQKNRAVLSAIPDMMFLLDRNGVFLDYKAEKESDLIVSPDMFLGKKVGDVLPPWLAELTMKTIARVLQTRSLQIFEYEIEMHGQIQHEEARCALCGSDEVLVVIRNITENRRLEQQVLQSQKMESLGTLAGGIAHDFNNILAGILGYASFLKSKIEPSHEYFKYADTIERSASRAADLTAKLLSFTRGDKENFKPLSINRVIVETLEIIRHTFDKSIHVKTRLAETLPTIEGDAGQVQQVVMNLCVNSRDAMRGGGEMLIETETVAILPGDPRAPAGARPGSYVKLGVRDSGSGMEREILARIFDPFFTTKPKGKGSGLGLSVVYGIVRGHEGFITVNSQRGKGSDFHVFFPASNRPEARQQLQAEPDSGRGELVFVVDDEEDIRSFISDVLTGHGYRVLLAGNGEQAIGMYRERFRDIGLVILDMAMPGLGGEEAFLEMKKINPAIQALVSSGFSQDGQAGDIVKMGVRGFLQKPYDFNQLLARIRQLLG